MQVRPPGRQRALARRSRLADSAAGSRAQLLYVAGITVCMALSLRIVLGTTMLTMLGPGKALRGPDGSMHVSVDGMLDEFERIGLTFHATIYSFMFTLLVFVWTNSSHTFAGAPPPPPPCLTRSAGFTTGTLLSPLWTIALAAA